MTARPTEVPVPRDRAEFRAFVRSHHPDLGGDPEIFAAVLSAYRDRSSAGPRRPGPGDVIVVHGRRGPAGAAHRVVRRLLDGRRPPRVL